MKFSPYVLSKLEMFAKSNDLLVDLWMHFYQRGKRSNDEEIDTRRSFTSTLKGQMMAITSKSSFIQENHCFNSATIREKSLCSHKNYIY